MTAAKQVIEKSLREKHQLSLNGLDDDVLEYLLNLDSESMTQQEIDEIIVAYFPTLDNASMLHTFKTALHECKQTTSTSNDENIPSLNPTPIAIIAETIANSPTCTQSIQENEDIEELHTMLPQIDVEHIRFVYHVRCSRCKVEAGRFLVENSAERIKELYEMHEVRLREKEKEELKEKRKMKSVIFEKYGTEEVRPKYDEKGNPIKASKPVVFIDAKKQAVNT